MWQILPPWTAQESNTHITTEQLEAGHSKQELNGAKRAEEFIKAAGFPSEKAAIDMVRDGNIKGLKVDVTDIKNYFKIYGVPVEAIRGKTTHEKAVNKRDDYDEGIREQRTMQIMTADVMYAGGHKFVVSVSKPLMLLMSNPTSSLRRRALGTCIQQHLDVLRVFGYDAKVIKVDPLKALAGLCGSIPGVEIDVSGAGDHLPDVDIRIRRIKEMARSVIQSLDWPLPQLLVPDLISFCVSRLNARRSYADLGNVCPRVKLTGRNIDFAKEFTITFGDYVETRDPQAVPNRIEDARTEPCVALFPSSNRNGSWKCFNLMTKVRVTRTVLKKMTYTPPIIIEVMRKYASAKPFTEKDFAAGAFPDEEVHDMPIMQTHIPNEEILDQFVEGDTGVDEDDEYAGDLAVVEPAASSEFGIEPLRKSTRSTAGKTSLFEDYHLSLANLSVKKALEDYGELARDAIQEEIHQLFHNKKALRIVPWKNVNPKIRTYMFLKLKIDADGKPEKMKARLVADGSVQDRSQYEIYDASSPTASLESIINVLKILVQEDRCFEVYDVTGAYLNADMQGLVYLIITDKMLIQVLDTMMPDLSKYKDQFGRVLVIADKAMYGLIESASLWNKAVTKVLVDDGFIVNPCDPCVFNRMSVGIQTTVVLYVDDLFVSSKERTHISDVKNLIELHFDEMKKKTGPSVTYLGMSLTRFEDSIHITMKALTDSILQEWSGEKLYPYSTPADEKLFYDHGDDKTLDPSTSKKFHKTVAKLLYLCKRARLDNALSVHYLYTRVKRPSQNDLQKLLRILGYLSATKEMPRIIQRDEDFPKLSAHIDAAFAAHSDGKGHSGGAIVIGKCVVEIITRKQKRASKDSTEAELIALSDLSNDVCWSKEWWEGQGYKIEKPIIFQDNKSTIHLVTEGGGKMRSKQLRALQASVKQGIEDDDYGVDYCKTEDMISDSCTKPTGGGIFKKFRNAVMGNVREIHPKLKRVIESIGNKFNGTKSERCTDMRTVGVRCDNKYPRAGRERGDRIKSSSHKTNMSARSATHLNKKRVGGVPFTY